MIKKNKACVSLPKGVEVKTPAPYLFFIFSLFMTAGLLIVM